jgi:hypothetical protein
MGSSNYLLINQPQKIQKLQPFVLEDSQDYNVQIPHFLGDPFYSKLLYSKMYKN